MKNWGCRMNRFNEEIWSIQNTISYYTNILHKREDSLTEEKSRYKDKILPPCKKCMRETYIGYDGKCVVPNTRKDTSLPTTRVVKTIPIDLNEEEGNKDDFNITILKQYFINFKKSIGKIKIAVIALDDFFDSHDFDDCWIDRDVKVGSEHEGDIFCGFDLDIDKEWFKKLLEDYGFVLEDDEDGFWITGVKK